MILYPCSVWQMIKEVLNDWMIYEWKVLSKNKSCKNLPSLLDTLPREDSPKIIFFISEVHSAPLASRTNL